MFSRFLGLLLGSLLGLYSSFAVAQSFDKNVPVEIRDQMLADLGFIASIQGTQQTKFHQQIFSKVDGATYKTFFEQRVRAVGMNACGGGAAVACVIPFMNPSKMWLTQNFVRFSHPQVARMMIVFHEARHTESRNGNWPHDECPTPFLDENGKEIRSIWTGAQLAGEEACDSTPFGSYGSSTIMLKNIAKFCENCSDKVKMDADIYANDQLNRIDVPQVKQSMKDDFSGT